MKLILAFAVGGAISALVQLLIDLTCLTPAKILVLLVVFGVFLGAVGLYEPLFKIFGCGMSVPLIGFGSAVARGVREAVMSDGFLGVIGGAFSAMGAGCAAALICGFIASLLVKGKSKKM
ncbi:MAG: SpoVA/SpoVAEb family sporulation membrane protein [Clostridia bacterium]|nr:SpoVA/SpoVAEb family sporulation membrane protein [Clostridia bacterium]